MDASSENAFYEQVNQAHAIPLWRRKEAMERAPLGTARPFVWRWADLAPLLHQAGGFDLGEAVHRRVLSMANPSIPFTAAVTENLGAGFQMILPGEEAPSHRHSMAALRWIVESSPDDALTVVDGEPIPMAPNDLILTPQGCWHDHRHHGTGPVVWLDGLDAPLIRRLGAVFMQNGSALQPLTKPPDASSARFGTGAVLPAARSQSSTSPLRRYPYASARRALLALASQKPGNAEDEFSVEYVNPVTGGPALPTISCSLLLVPAGATVRLPRRVSSAVLHVVEGTGYSTVGQETLSWTVRDTLAIPSWAEVVHTNPGSDPAILFCFSDRPVYQALHLTRWESPQDPPPGGAACAL